MSDVFKKVLKERNVKSICAAAGRFDVFIKFNQGTLYVQLRTWHNIAHFSRGAHHHRQRLLSRPQEVMTFRYSKKRNEIDRIHILLIELELACTRG